jgi:hypothetical protein
MSFTLEDRPRQLEQEVQFCRAAVLRDAPGTVGDTGTALGQLPADDDSRDIRLEKLGDALLESWDLSGGAAKLEEAIAAYGEVL